MYKLFVFAICGCIMIQQSHAQTSLEGILQQVEQNNQVLSALKSKVESEQLALKSANNLPDPEFGLYYLPFGNHAAGDYSEYQISQSFEFPTVYGARNQLIGAQTRQLELEYKAQRKSILAETKGHCLEIIYLNKRRAIEAQRIEQARSVLEQVQTLFDKEQVGILELNKAKVAWMQDRFKLHHIDTQLDNLKRMLATLNGGNAITMEVDQYVAALDLPTIESLWDEKHASDPALHQLKQQQAIAAQQLKLSKSKSLPNLTAGFNSQGVAGDRFSGIYAGVTIPLWSKRNTVKSARSKMNYQEAFVDARLQMAYSMFEKEYNDYQHKLLKFQEYQQTLEGLNTENVLLEAYRIGELSYLEYYMELQFYRNAYDTMLEMQHQLYQAQKELLKHQL